MQQIAPEKRNLRNVYGTLVCIVWSGMYSMVCKKDMYSQDQVYQPSCPGLARKINEAKLLIHSPQKKKDVWLNQLAQSKTLVGENKVSASPAVSMNCFPERLQNAFCAGACKLYQL